MDRAIKYFRTTHNTHEDATGGIRTAIWMQRDREMYVIRVYYEHRMKLAWNIYWNTMNIIWNTMVHRMAIIVHSMAVARFSNKSRYESTSTSRPCHRLRHGTGIRLHASWGVCWQSPSLCQPWPGNHATHRSQSTWHWCLLATTTLCRPQRSNLRPAFGLLLWELWLLLWEPLRKLEQ